MIFFVISNDLATSANLQIIKPIIPAGNLSLTDTNATKENITHALSQNKEHLFAMSHGESSFFYDNNNEQAIKCEEAIMLNGRICFVYACYTANRLGRAAACNNAIYWGYSGPIGAPDESPQTITIFQSIFTYIISHFTSTTDPVLINDIIKGIKAKCDEADSLLDDLALPTLDSYFATRHIWSRLRVNHYATQDEQLLHDEADRTDLFEFRQVF